MVLEGSLEVVLGWWDGGLSKAVSLLFLVSLMWLCDTFEGFCLPSKWACILALYLLSMLASLTFYLHKNTIKFRLVGNNNEFEIETWAVNFLIIY